MTRYTGVIEGFYGRPYSFSECHSLISLMGKWGLNTYLYGPKNDTQHRNRWREPYTPEELALFSALVQHARDAGVDFVVGLSPLEFHYSSSQDLDTLLFKQQQFLEIGVTSFSLLLDDMPERFRYEDDAEKFGTLAHAQSWLCEQLRERTPGVFSFVPTEYHGKGDSPYLRELGERLPENIEIFWTGRDVCSPSITTEHTRTVSKTLKRKVVYWDNYPVNDLEMRFDPHLLPYRNREAGVLEESGGILLNLALQPEASKIPLITFARFVQDGEQYQPDAAWQEALIEVTGNAEDARALELLADLARRDPLDPKGTLDNHLYPLMDAFWEELGGAPEVAGPELQNRPARKPASGTLREAARELELAVFRLEHLKNRKLLADLHPWTQKLGGQVRILKLALAVIDNPQDARLREVIFEDLPEVRANFHWVAGDLIDQFARRCVWYAHQKQRQE
ncbi:protein O-GlcNAcase [Deinococcus cellulosilyticus]|uniref:GH84 domain-containing protein n=1 Tax=Deinococcus cellulosilyticus (strain DSM 18568 / NBRC 106333 / KACC 11606 / 5516J-15) TaxID=1223518 RepID=A0A511N309_DEIC1|nr:protein O-GlcNAcase [Deinococcus cellulosilyticus]GEM47240.1 hypothetical protein DC3_28750 [Deinococcus cellulosilyticus NBRC 106333 = KACC 11606]